MTCGVTCGGGGDVNCVLKMFLSSQVLYCVSVGSGRVTFGNPKSFLKAVQSGFMEIKTSKFTKKVC